MKKIVVITIAFLLIFTTACQSPQLGISNQPNDKAAVNNNVDKAIKEQIENIIKEEVRCIESLNSEKNISLINPADSELIMEQTNWFNDLKLEPIEDFSIKLLGITQIDDGNYKAEVEQRYSRNGEKASIKYFKSFIKTGDKIYDAGNYFEEASSEHFIVKYTDKNDKVALQLLQELEPIYEEYVERWKLSPERKVAVKMFDNKEELRQSIKLSMWTCAGWYEFGESVRMYIESNMQDVGSIAYVIRHELVHLFTMTRAKGNVAYWLAEGLATNYQNKERFDYTANLISSGNKLITVEQLEEMELEKLEDAQEIRGYYLNAELITSFIIERYGEAALDAILDRLAERPSLEGTGHENDTMYKEYLHEILPQVLKLKDYDEFMQLWQQEINKATKE